MALNTSIATRALIITLKLPIKFLEFIIKALLRY